MSDISHSGEALLVGAGVAFVREFDEEFLARASHCIPADQARLHPSFRHEDPTIPPGLTLVAAEEFRGVREYVPGDLTAADVAEDLLRDCPQLFRPVKEFPVRGVSLLGDNSSRLRPVVVQFGSPLVRKMTRDREDILAVATRDAAGTVEELGFEDPDFSRVTIGALIVARGICIKRMLRSIRYALPDFSQLGPVRSVIPH